MSKHWDYIFYSNLNNNTFFILMDRNGNIVRSEEIPLTVECFVKAMLKIGYKRVADLCQYPTS